jgi:hypothetical protein
MVNLGKGFRGDQVLSCRSFCWAFFLALAHRQKNGENRILMSPLTNACFQLRGRDENSAEACG